MRFCLYANNLSKIDSYRVKMWITLGAVGNTPLKLYHNARPFLQYEATLKGVRSIDLDQLINVREGDQQNDDRSR